MIDPRLLDQVESLVVLTVEERDQLAGLLEDVTYQSGTTLVEEGQRAPGLFMMLSGALQIERTLHGEIDRTLATRIPAGEWFGMVSVIDGLPATASVMARSDVHVAFLSKSDFFGLLAAGDGLGSHLLRALLRSLSTQLEQINEVLVGLHLKLESPAPTGVER